jgi:hypothetical protein
MRCIPVVISLLITGCIHSSDPLTLADTTIGRSAAYQQEIDNLLAADSASKKWQRIYLQEIATAQENSDRDAYKFFIVEFIKLPRYKIPEWMQKEPNYTPPVSEADVLRLQFKIITK